MTTYPNATGYTHQRHLDRTQNGVLWSMHLGAANTLTFRYSTDNGVTWATGATIGSVADNAGGGASLFIDVDDYAHVVYRHSGDLFLYYQRGTPNADRTAYTFSALQRIIPGSTDQGYVNPNVIAHREGTGWVAWVPVSYASSGTNAVYLYRFIISSAGAITHESVRSFGVNGVSSSWPALDFHHTGDAKTVKDGLPHLYFAWATGQSGAGKGLRFTKATYSGGSWTWGADVAIDETLYQDGPANFRSGMSCLWDGSRVIIAGNIRDANVNYGSAIWERDAADTTTTVLRKVGGEGHTESASYDQSGNVYFVGVHDPAGTGTKLAVNKWTRATGALTTTVLDTLTGAHLGTFPSMRRGHAGSRVDWIYTHGNNSPYAIKYDRIALNVAPLAPTRTAPADGVTFDRATPQRFTWTINDPDTNDTQSKYDLDYRAEGTTAWTTVTGATPNQYHDFAAGFFAAGDYEWRVRTYDAQGLVGPYSTIGFFTAANAPAAPTITDPSSGGTVNTDPYLIQWSYPTQAAYQLRKLDDNAGAVGATVLFDSGIVNSSGARSRSVAFPVQDRHEHIQVRVKDTNGLWSPYASHRVLVSYTRPVTPSLSVAAVQADAALRVVVTNDPPNLLPNDAASSFEDGTVGGWFVRAGAVISNSATGATHGTKALRIEAAAAGANHGADSPFVPIPAGAAVTMSLDLRAGVGAASVRAIIGCFDAADAYLGNVNAGTLLTLTAVAQRAVVSGTTLSGTAKVRATVYHDAVGSAVGDYYLADAVQVEQGSIATAYHTPSTPAVATVDVLRRVVNSGAAGERLVKGLAANASWLDHSVNSGTDYEYQVVAYGSNGTSSTSAWQP